MIHFYLAVRTNFSIEVPRRSKAIGRRFELWFG